MESTSKLIALAGATCSGKTTLSERLSTNNVLPHHSIIIHQDDYYKDDESVPWSNGIPLWDDPSSLWWDNLIQRIKDTLHYPSTHCKTCQKNGTNISSHLIIVEGTMLLYSKEILDLCHKSFFITLDYETCLQRRKVCYGNEDRPHFFERHVWPMYCDMARTVHTLSKVTILNGIRSLEEIERDISRQLVNCYHS